MIILLNNVHREECGPAFGCLRLFSSVFQLYSFCLRLVAEAGIATRLRLVVDAGTAMPLRLVVDAGTVAVRGRAQLLPKLLKLQT